MTPSSSAGIGSTAISRTTSVRGLSRGGCRRKNGVRPDRGSEEVENT